MATRPAVFLAALLPLAAHAQIDSAALLDQARAKIVENVEKLPKYTCIQSVHRARQETFPALQVSGCGYVQDPSIVQHMWVAWTDQFKLDVTVSRGTEIFSWVGARQFQSEEINRIVGGGMTGTGDFGPFLMSIFSAGASAYQYLGAQEDDGRTLAVYQYHVPIAESHYQVRVGRRPQDLVTMAYEGRFWVDPANARLIRMTIEVPDPPRESHSCRVQTTVDYQQAHIGSSDFLLPRLTVLRMWDTGAQRFDNRIEYSGCREFHAESVFRTDFDASPTGPLALAKPLSIPSGITLKIALRSKIDSETSYAGDAIEGRLLNAVRSADGAILVPEGSTVHGRIVRLEHDYRPSNYFSLGLIYNSLDAGGGEVPLKLVSVGGSKHDRMLADPQEKRQGMATFLFQTDRLILDQSFVSNWKTR